MHGFPWVSGIPTVIRYDDWSDRNRMLACLAEVGPVARAARRSGSRCNDLENWSPSFVDSRANRACRMKQNQGEPFVMSYAVRSSTTGPWWREPTKDQWYAFIAAWLGWTLDAVVFTGFLFLLV